MGGKDKTQDAETIIYDGMLTSRKKIRYYSRVEKLIFMVDFSSQLFGFESGVQDQLSIKGAKFSADISTYLKDDDYACEKNSDGLTTKTYPYVVLPKKIVNISALSGLMKMGKY